MVTRSGHPNVTQTGASLAANSLAVVGQTEMSLAQSPGTNDPGCDLTKSATESARTGGRVLCIWQSTHFPLIPNDQNG